MTAMKTKKRKSRGHEGELPTQKRSKLASASNGETENGSPGLDLSDREAVELVKKRVKNLSLAEPEESAMKKEGGKKKKISREEHPKSTTTVDDAPNESANVVKDKKAKAKKERLATKSESDKEHVNLDSDSDELGFEHRRGDAGARPGRPVVTDERRQEAVLYDQLRSEDQASRVDAATRLLLRLHHNTATPEAELERHLTKLLAGLASGAKGARLGYSIVITDMLRFLLSDRSSARQQYPRLTFEYVFDILRNATAPRGNISGQAERDYFFGRLFGIECFVKAGSVGSDVGRWHAVLEMLLELAARKIWLKSQCCWVILSVIRQAGRGHAEMAVRVMAEAGLAETPEGVAVWIAAVDRFPDLKMPSKPWKAHPLAAASLSRLAAVLADSVGEDADEPPPTGQSESKAAAGQQLVFTGQLHCVWDVILEHYHGGGSAQTADFAAFWVKAVDERLFSRNASPFQKFRGFLLLTTFLQGLTTSQDAKSGSIQGLFAKHMMTSLMNHASQKDRYLNRAAQKALAAIRDLPQARGFVEGALFAVLNGLLGKDGAFNFDQRTRSETVAKLLQCVTDINSINVLKLLKSGAASAIKHEPDNAVKMARVYAEYLYNLTLSDSNATELALRELIDLAYLNPTLNVTITDDLRSFCRDRLQKAFGRLIRVNALDKICQTVLAIPPPDTEMDEEIAVKRHAALHRLKSYADAGSRETGSGEQGRVAMSLALLHAVALLQLYAEEPDALDLLADLEKLGDAEGADTEFLVEVLLSVMAQRSSMARQVVVAVFESFTADVSAKALAVLTRVLEAEENAAGHAALFHTSEEMDLDGDGEEDDEDEEESDSDEDSSTDDEQLGSEDDLSDMELGPDAGLTLLNGKDDDDSDEQEDGSASDEGDDDEEEEEEDNDDKAQAEMDDILAKVLNSHRLDKDGDASSSDSDADMSDSEMMQLDGKLAEVFRHRAAQRESRGSGAKKEGEQAKEMVLYFKNRVLDLLSVYVRREPLAPAGLNVLAPVLRLARTTSSRDLGVRAHGLIKSYWEEGRRARGRGAVAVGVDEETGLELLGGVHREAALGNGKAFEASAGTASLLVAEGMWAWDRSSFEAVGRRYLETQADVVLRGAKIGIGFFQGWIAWGQALGDRKGTGEKV